MSSETIFLQQNNTNYDPNPNFVTAQGNTIYFNYSQSPSGSLTNSQTDTLVKGGVGVAIAEAQAIFFNNDPTFSSLFTDTSVIELDGQFTGSAKSKTKVVASFAVGANQNFSFEFSADLALTAKEIENPKVEYNKASSRTAFLVLDTTNPNKPKIIDYFGIQGKLISSKKIGNLTLGRSRNITINSRNKSSDINGNNGSDFLNGSAFGTYQRNFKRNTNITIVEINISAVELAGDSLIGNLGKDVIYGTIWKDNLIGTNGADKIYASLGDDKLYGKKGNDILDGGQGNDLLDGGDGNDTLYGGLGNDILIGGRGSDVLIGGAGNDKFVFNRGDSLLKDEFDIIQDFEVGIDKIVFDGWGKVNSTQWLNQMFSQGRITDTNDGVLFDFNTGITQGKLLLSDISSNLITSESIKFV